MKPTLAKHDVLSRLAEHGPATHARGVHRPGLFGSFARDDAHAQRDVDLLVCFWDGEKTLANRFELSELLEALLGRRVELVTPESVSEELLARILEEVGVIESVSGFTPAAG